MRFARRSRSWQPGPSVATSLSSSTPDTAHLCTTMMATNLTARTNVPARTISPAKDPLRTTRCSTSYSYEYFEGRPNGAFTFAALRALESLKPKATYRDWFMEIRKPLPSQQYSQSPNLYGSTSMGRWKMFE